MKTSFERSQAGQRAFSLPKEESAWLRFFPDESLLRKEPLLLPELSELDLTRHFSALASRNVGVDNCFYPLGSCTMKFNPRINEQAASNPRFAKTHPLAPSESVQGNLELIFHLIELLAAISGMDAGTLLPSAGAQGEFVGIQMIRAYHEERRDGKRIEMLIPDSAHGTNPATAAMAGFKAVSIKTGSNGDLDLSHLQASLSERTAGLMLTNPNTLGLFSPNILTISKAVHEAGGLLFYDGANLNAILELARPGEMGFDVMHLNLHKTFSTPHGGGGPGAGPVLCKKFLEKFLPVPRVFGKEGAYHLISQIPSSIGRISSFHGNFGICLRAYLYILLHGRAGLRRIAEQAVLNANYLKKKLEPLFKVPFPQFCMHEFVIQVDREEFKALDVAKRLLDYGVYAPTIYFPLTVKECMLIEPTESESKATLDEFVEILKAILQEDPELVRSAPHAKPVSRLDEVRAAKRPQLKQSL